MTEKANRVGEFLRARRDLVTPEQAGLAVHGARRVPGLRREEVAMLAGISADYYLRLEQGRDTSPSLIGRFSALGVEGFIGRAPLRACRGARRPGA